MGQVIDDGPGAYFIRNGRLRLQRGAGQHYLR